jgi:hypothetical protein
METYLDAFLNALSGTFNWTLKSIMFNVPWYLNYFWGLIFISLLVWFLEIVFPWRKEQGVFRKDFWLVCSENGLEKGRSLIVLNINFK